MTASRLSARRPVPQAAVDRLETWIRERFELPDDAAVMVAQIACGLPGCPPLETVVVFWTEDETRHRFKVFKPAAEVGLADLPVGWLKSALAAPEGFDFDCC